MLIKYRFAYFLNSKFCIFHVYVKKENKGIKIKE